MLVNKQMKSLRAILPFCLAVLPAFGVVAAASTTSTSFAGYQWHTFFGGDDYEGSNLPATTVDSSGNLYLTGKTQRAWDGDGNPSSTYTLSSGGYVAYVTKISPSGQILWNRFFPEYPNQIGPHAITLDSAGHIFIAGEGNVRSEHSNVYGGFILELNAVGTDVKEIWGANIGSAAYGIAYDSAHDLVYLTGTVGDNAWGVFTWTQGIVTEINSRAVPGSTAMFILEAKGGVGLDWVGFYQDPLDAINGGGLEGAWGQAIAYDGASGLYVAGHDHGYAQAAVWKVSTSGSLVWEKEYGAGNNSWAYALALYGGNVYVTGHTTEAWLGPNYQPPLNAFVAIGTPCNAYVLKLDSDGNYVWHTFYPGANADRQTTGRAIAVDHTGSGVAVYVAGTGDLVGYNNAAAVHDVNGHGRHFILQLDESGAYQWHSLYGAAEISYDEADSIAVDSAHDVYVSGFTGYATWNGDNDTAPLHASSLAGSSIFVMKLGVTEATTTTASTPAPLTYSTSAQAITLGATVTSTSTVNSGTVAFSLLGSTVTANVAGGSATASFTVPAGTPAGSYPLQATYAPGTGFAASSDSGQKLVIAKATPVITWANPADIVVGTALGSTQLNASASVAGTFVYAPVAGTALATGNSQTLSTTFTPTDTTDYATAAASVLINVTPLATPAQIVVTKTLARNASGQVVVTLNFSNSGGTNVLNLQLTVGKINSTSGTPLSQSLGTVAKGATVTTTLTFPSSVGSPGTAAVLTVSGAYTGGSFNSASRIALP